MSWNSLKLALRELYKSKVSTVVNIVGFTFGFACFIYLINWVKFEHSFDKYHANYNSIYRLVKEKNSSCWTPATLKSYLEGQVPEIKSISRIRKENDIFIKADNQDYIIDDLLFADKEFLTIYSHHFKQGDSKNSLKTPNSIVITESLAKRFFGDKNPIGLSISYENFYDFTVEAVIEDVPNNSSLQYEAIASFLSLKDVYEPSRPKFNVLEEDGDWSFNTLVLLDENTDIQAINKKITSISQKRLDSFYDPGFYLQPLKEFYFSELDNDKFIKQGNLKFTKILLFIAIFIIFLAFMNYLNLSTAKSSEKIKNLSVFRFVGAGKFNLTQPSIFEAIIIVTASLLLSFLLIYGFIFYSDSEFSPQLFLNENLGFTVGVAFILLVLAITAGVVPTILLLKFRITSNFGKVAASTGPLFGKGRMSLCFVQFLVSISLIISTITVIKQIDFLKNSELGFDKESVVFIKMRPEATKYSTSLKSELLKTPNIKSVSFSDGLPGSVRNGNALIKEDKKYSYNDIYTDPDFAQTLGLEILKGRNFSWDRQSDFEQTARIVNETAVKEFGWENPLEETIWGAPVVGVMKDFHFRSMHEKITPVVLRCQSEFNINTINIKIETKDLASAISSIKKCWTKTTPGFPFEVNFLDDSIQQLYSNEIKFGKTLGVFTMISIIISCLGIFGLSYFIIDKRTKEIGIRKVNGAKVSEVLTMLNKDLVKWVIIAFIIASPLAYFAMQEWLENFAYKIELSWWIFAMAGILALGIALLTVSWQTWRAARRNPVEALRYE